MFRLYRLQMGADERCEKKRRGGLHRVVCLCIFTLSWGGNLAILSACNDLLLVKTTRMTALWSQPVTKSGNGPIGKHAFKALKDQQHDWETHIFFCY